MSIKVLIVEDDPMVADINKNFVEAVADFSVIALARSGSEALKILQKNEVDLVLLDVYMPNVDGLEFLSAMRGSGRIADVIMVTAANDTATIRKTFLHGVVGYIIKPFKFEKLQATLEAYREYKKQINTRKNVSQEDLDRILPLQRGKTAPGLPKNIQEQTLHKIVDYLSQAPAPQSAEEVAAGVGVARVTARRYLEYMVTVNQAKTVLEYMTIGRPVHRFELVPKNTNS